MNKSEPRSFTDDAVGGSVTVEGLCGQKRTLQRFFAKIKMRIICADTNTPTSAVSRPQSLNFGGCALIAVLNKTLRQQRRAPNTQSLQNPAPPAPSESWPLIMIYGSLRCLSKPEAGLIKCCKCAEVLPCLLQDTCGVIIHWKYRRATLCVFASQILLPKTF